MWRVKLAKVPFAPNIKLSVCWERSRKLSCSNFNHLSECKFFKECWQGTTVCWWCPYTKLASTVAPHSVDFSVACQYYWMMIPRSNFNYFIRHSSYVVRSRLIIKCAKAKLAFLITSAHKKSTYVINKARVKATCRNRFDVRSVILIKVNCARRVLRCSFLSAYCSSTLSEFVLPPSKYITNLSPH